MTICTENGGRMFSYLNNSQRGTLLSTFMIIHIALFCNLKILLLWDELLQKIVP